MNYLNYRSVFILLSLIVLTACGSGESLVPSTASVPSLFPSPTFVPTQPPPATAVLYSSPQQFVPATPLDGYNVTASYGSGSNAYTRTIPVLVRYPQGATGKLPLILWSHGGSKNPDGKNNNVDWGNSFVSAGYIVVHMSHLPRTLAENQALLTEWGLTVAQINSPTCDPNSSDGTCAFSESTVDRPRDAIAVLNDLPTIENAFPQLLGKIDYARIGMGGHSFGSYTVRTVECARPNLAPGYQNYSFTAPGSLNTPLRIRPIAYLNNSPQGPNRFGFFDFGGGNHSWNTCIQPDLTQTGLEDNTPGELAVDRIKPFALMPPGDKYKMYINAPGTPHETFNLSNSQQPQFESYIRSTGIAFMDATLKGLPTAKAYLTSQSLGTISNNVATVESR